MDKPITLKLDVSQIEVQAQAKGLRLVKAHVDTGIEYLVDQRSECLFQGTLNAAKRFIDTHMPVDERLAA